MLTREQKKLIIDYVFTPDAFWKGLMEGTELGETYGEPGGVTEDDFHNFIMEMKKREEAYQGLTQRKMLLNFDHPIHFQMPDGRSADVQAMKIVENGAGYGKHLIFAVLPLLGDMTKVDPPVEASIKLGINMRTIQEIKG